MKLNPRFFLFASIVFMIIGLMHYFSYSSTLDPLDTTWNAFITTALSLVFLLIFISMSSRFMRKPIEVLSWPSFIWLGFLWILFAISILKFILENFGWQISGASVWVASTALSIYALYEGLKSPRILSHSMSDKPELKGLKIVQISDLHIGLLNLDHKWLKNLVNTINQIEPHFIFITGDLVEESIHKVLPKLQALKSLRPQIESFFVTGNHEYIHGGSIWENHVRSLDITVLHNDHKLVSYNEHLIMIAGVPDRTVHRFEPQMQSLPHLALQSESNCIYKILLAHEPSSVFDLKSEKCDLILSGHTHGGQIFPFSLLVRLAQPVNSGFKTIEGTKVYVNSGTGYWGPPMRLGTQSEITLFNWI